MGTREWGDCEVSYKRRLQGEYLPWQSWKRKLRTVSWSQFREGNDKLDFLKVPFSPNYSYRSFLRSRLTNSLRDVTTGNSARVGRTLAGLRQARDNGKINREERVAWATQIVRKKIAEKEKNPSEIYEELGPISYSSSSCINVATFFCRVFNKARIRLEDTKNHSNRSVSRPRITEFASCLRGVLLAQLVCG